MEDPNTVSVREVAGFMYGNGVPISEATECFEMSNGGRRAFIEQNMKLWYNEWNRSQYKPYVEKYYSVVLKQFAWIHGRAYDGIEVCESALPVRHFGPGPSGCAAMIRCAIDNVRKGSNNVKVRLPLSEIDVNKQRR